MRLFNIALFSVLSLFVCARQPEILRAQSKIEGTVYRSVFLGEGVRVEIMSVISVKESEKENDGTDTPKTYLYSYLVENKGEKDVKLEFLNLSDDPRFPSVRELEVKKSIIFSLKSKAKPKIMLVSQIVKVSEGGKWTSEGLNLSFIYVPDVPIRPPDDKNRANNKSTA